MSQPRFRLTVTRMMVFVACAAVSFAVYRLSFLGGCLAAFVSGISSYRTLTLRDRCQIAGKPLSIPETLETVPGSIFVAVIIMIFSVPFAFVGIAILNGLIMYLELPKGWRFGLYLPTPLGILMGVFMATRVAPLVWASNTIDLRLSTSNRITPVPSGMDSPSDPDSTS